MPYKFSCNVVRKKAVSSQLTVRLPATTAEVDERISCMTIVKLLIYCISKHILNIFFLVHCIIKIALVARILLVSKDKVEKLKFYL